MAEPYNALKPPPASEDKGGFEVLRAAIIDEGVHMSLRPSFDDPATWGMVLCDVVRQVSRAYAQAQMATEKDALARIRGRLIAELNAPAPADVESTIKPIE
jgi:hypothetical protein